MLLGTNPKNWVSRILGRQSNSPNYQTPPAPANPVSDAETLLSDDPNTWTRVLARFLERSSPEGYAFARDQGRLDWHLQQLTAWGREQSMP